MNLESSGLLDGLSGDELHERAELVRYLVGKGIALEHIRTSPVPTLLPARRLLGDDGTYVSARHISSAAGLDLETTMRFQRAAGLPHVEDPDAEVFMRADGQFALHIKEFLDAGIDPDDLVTVVRLLAEGFSRAAETMRASVTAAVVHPGVTEIELAAGAERAAENLSPVLGRMIQDILMLALRHGTESEAFNAAERAAGEKLPQSRMVAVGFADLVGFTRLGEELSPVELERVAEKLAEMARDVVGEPVRLVKTIGDAVMLVSTDTGALVSTMVELVDRVQADETLPQLRAGVSYGPAVSRAGDWFGSSVNTASRVTAIARPGSVVVTESARTEVGDGDFRWTHIGVRRLRGIPEGITLYRARGERDAVVRNRWVRHLPPRRWRGEAATSMDRPA